MKKLKQLSLFPNTERLFHGGRISIKKRKTRRPLSTKRPIHLVLKANTKKLFKNRSLIITKAIAYATKFQIKIYKQSVNFDHIHFVIKILSRYQYIQFIRAITSVLSRQLGHGLWALKPFTRVCSWGKEFGGLLRYLLQNDQEVFGLQPYKSRKPIYARYLAPPDI